MAEEELQVVTLRDDFYREGVRLVAAVTVILLTVIVTVVGVFAFLFLHKPPPVYFTVGDDWRVVQPVSVDRAYLNTADLVQWITNVLPKAFNLDFVNSVNSV